MLLHSSLSSHHNILIAAPWAPFHPVELHRSVCKQAVKMQKFSKKKQNTFVLKQMDIKQNVHNVESNLSVRLFWIEDIWNWSGDTAKQEKWCDKSNIVTTSYGK